VKKSLRDDGLEEKADRKKGDKTVNSGDSIPRKHSGVGEPSVGKKIIENIIILDKKM